MDIGVIGIWLLIVSGIIIIIIYSFRGIKKWKTTTVGIVPTISGKCEPAFNTLPDVSDYKCCVTDGNPTYNKYYDIINMVISPTITPYKQACSGFCLYGVGSNDKCISDIGQTEYNICLANLQPQNCIGLSQPIAKVGITYYYGYAVGQSSCENTQVCLPTL